MNEEAQHRIEVCNALLETWVHQTIKSIELSKEPNEFSAESFRRIGYDSFDERSAKLAEGLLLQMPKPLQTLLSALEHLKLDITKEQVHHVNEYETMAQNELDNLVLSCCKSMHRAQQSIAVCYKEGLQDLQTDSLDSQVSMFFTEVMTRLPMSNFLEHDLEESKPLASKAKAVQSCMDQLEQQLFYVVAQESKNHVTVKRLLGNPSESIQKSKHAMQTSEQLRNRIKSLSESNVVTEVAHYEESKAEGPVKALESLSSVQISKTMESSEKEALEGLLLTGKSIVRSIQRLLRSIEQAKSSCTDKAIEACCKSMKESLSKVNRQRTLETSLSKELLDTDTAIQAEIKLFLQTISVDRSHLDTLLRSIKLKCLQIKHEYCAEQSGIWAISLARWRMQLQDSISAFLLQMQVSFL